MAPGIRAAKFAHLVSTPFVVQRPEMCWRTLMQNSVSTSGFEWAQQKYVALALEFMYNAWVERMLLLTRIGITIGLQVKTDVARNSVAPKFLKDVRMGVVRPETDVLRVRGLSACCQLGVYCG